LAFESELLQNYFCGGNEVERGKAGGRQASRPEKGGRIGFFLFLAGLVVRDRPSEPGIA
jgi:hypothetical protein